jgi:hypothetical protein
LKNTFEHYPLEEHGVANEPATSIISRGLRVLGLTFKHKLPILCVSVVDDICRSDQRVLVSTATEASRTEFNLEFLDIDDRCISRIEWPVRKGLLRSNEHKDR